MCVHVEGSKLKCFFFLTDISIIHKSTNCGKWKWHFKITFCVNMCCELLLDFDNTKLLMCEILHALLCLYIYNWNTRFHVVYSKLTMQCWMTLATMTWIQCWNNNELWRVRIQYGTRWWFWWLLAGWEQIPATAMGRSQVRIAWVSFFRVSDNCLPILIDCVQPVLQSS